MLTIDNIGRPTTIPGWPANNVDGLFDALARWQLDERLNYSNDPHFLPHPDRAPFRSPARRYSGQSYDQSLGHTVYLGDGAPCYPEAPDAVAFCGNFIGYSFGFRLDTDDRDLIARLDSAIAANLARGAR